MTRSDVPKHLEPAPAESPGNPFKGLAYYETRDKDRFAGRQRDIETVASGILRTRTFVLYGRSGLGKTSLLLAGVFPRLADQGCRTIDVRLLDDPVSDLRRALGRQCGLKEEEATTTDLADLIRRFSQTPEGEDRLAVIAFDQFEEFYVRYADQPDPAGGVRSGEELDRKVRQRRITQREDFIREIGRLAADSSLNLRLVFSLREDWVAQMGDFAAAIPGIMQHMHRLLPLTSFGVRQAVVETLRTGHVDFDSRLISALVDNLADVQFDPVVLQVLCSEVWETARKRCKDGPLRLEVADLVLKGGVRDVFRGFLDKAFQEIGPEPPPRRRKILTGAVLDALISEKRTKQAMSADALRRQHFHIEVAELSEVLDRLARNQLVRLDPRGGGWYELVHERLVGAILEWFETDRDFFAFRSARQLVVNTCRNQRWQDNPELWLNARQLDVTVGPFKEILQFNGEEKLFLVSSAVYGSSRDLEFWFDLAGMDIITKLLDRFLDQTDHEQLLVRALEAAGRVEERRDHFARRCLKFALHDQSQVVRQAGARSFADLASPEDFEDFAHQLAEGRHKKAARSALVEVLDKDRLPAGLRIGRFDLWKARRALYERRLDAARPEVRARGQQGARIGLKAGLLWSLTAGLLLMRVAVYEFFPEKATGAWWFWLAVWAVYLLAAVPFGGFAGRRAARRVAQEALRRGKEGLVFEGLTGGPVLKTLHIGLPVALSLGVAGVLGDLSNEMGKKLAIWMLILGWGAFIPLGLVYAAAFVARLSQPVLAACREGWERWLWAWLWAFGAALLLPLIVGQFLDRRPHPDIWATGGWQDVLGGAYFGLGGLLVLLVAAGGVLTLSSLVAMEVTVKGVDAREGARLGAFPGAPSRRSEGAAKAAGILVAVVAAGLLFFEFGWDSLPGLARRIELDNPVLPRFGVGAGPYDTIYVDLRASSAPERGGAPRVAELASLEGWSSYFAGHSVEGAVLVFLPGKRNIIAFHRDGSRASANKILPRADRPLAEPRQPGEETRLAVVRMKAGPSKIWSARPEDLDQLARWPQLELGLGRTALGGDQCADAALSVRIRSAAGEGGMVGVDCSIEADRIPFSNSFGRADRVEEVTVQAWRPKLLGLEGEDYATALSPDGSRILTVSSLGRARLWSLASPSAAYTLFESFPVKAAVFSPDGRRVAAIARDTPEVRVWDLKQPGRAVSIPIASDVDRISFAPDGSRLAIITTEPSLLIQELQKGILLGAVPLTEDASSVAFSPTGRQFATADWSGVVRFWTDGGDLVSVLHCPSFLGSRSDEDSFLGFTADGSRLLAAVSGEQACLWDTAEKPAKPLRFFPGKVRLNADGRHILDFSEKGLSISDVETLKVERRLPFPARRSEMVPPSPWISPDGRLAALVEYGGRVTILRTDRNTEPIVLPNTRGVEDVIFDPKGTRVALRLKTGGVSVWNLNDPGQSISGAFPGELSLVGDRVLTVPKKGPPQVWDLSQPLDPEKVGDLFLFLRLAPPSEPGT